MPPPQSPPQSPRVGTGSGSRADSGGHALEYAALIVLVAGIAASVLAAGIPGAIARAIENALCPILGTGRCPHHRSSQPQAAHTDYEPRNCLLALDSETAGRTIDIAFFSLGAGAKLTSATHSDGRVLLTLVDSAKLSLGVGIGAGAGVRGIARLGAEANVSASLRFPFGSTWVFPDADAAERFRADLRAHMIRDSMRRHGGFGAVTADVLDPLPELRPPDITRRSVEVGAAADAAIGGGLGRQAGGGRPGTAPDTNRLPQDWSLSPRIEANGAIPVAGVLSTEVDRAAHTTSTTYALKGGYDVKAGAISTEAEWEYGARKKGALKVTRDERGRIVRLAFTHTRGSKSVPEVVSTVLEPHGREQRRIIEDWLSSGPARHVLALDWESLAPQRLGDDPTPFQELLFQRGRVSRIRYTGTVRDGGLHASAKFGLQLGVGLSWGGTSRHVRDAQYLGAPRGGERGYVPYRQCQ